MNFGLLTPVVMRRLALRDLAGSDPRKDPITQSRRVFDHYQQ